MKPYIKLFFIGLLSFSLIACDTDDDADEVRSINPTSVQVNDLTGNRFVVELFDDEGEDETAEFAGYLIEFLADNEFQITGNGVNVSGSWELEDDNSELEIELNGYDKDPLEELAEDWIIESWDGTILKLVEEDDDLDERLHLKVESSK